MATIKMDIVVLGMKREVVVVMIKIRSVVMIMMKHRS